MKGFDIRENNMTHCFIRINKTDMFKHAYKKVMAPNRVSARKIKGAMKVGFVRVSFVTRNFIRVAPFERARTQDSEYL